MHENIIVRGARVHNLKNINVQIPRDKLIVITGLSGSGKSSLAFDTLYAEGQRRYVESLSAYARQFLSVMEKPDVDYIEGLSPAISIEQKSTSHNPRSTVGTVTEIYDYLRLLFARVGQPKCPIHHITLEAQTVSQMVEATLALPNNSKIMLLAPIVRDRKGEHVKLLQNLQSQGFLRARIDGETRDLDEHIKLNPKQKHTIEIVVDRLKVNKDAELRLADSFETALKLSDGLAIINVIDSKDEEMVFSAKYACAECGYNLEELEPRSFSFNNPAGACPTCDGLGVEQFFDPDKVVYQPDMSINSGAIKGWDKRNGYYYCMLDATAKHFKFSLDTPFNKLSKKHRDIVLYGSNGTMVKFKYESDSGLSVSKEIEFEGVINNLERRYKETESNYVREEIGQYISEQLCQGCQGMRLKESSRNVFIADKNINEVTHIALDEALNFFKKLSLPGQKAEIAKKIVKEITDRITFLIDVGLDYLTLDRSAQTLSGGEAQRIRLASQIGAGLVGVMYILDEPSIGLHQRDNDRLLKTLKHLRDLGNTVIIVEHDEDAMLAADYVIDIGPRAGVHGGRIIAQGTPDEIKKNKESITGQYLSGKLKIDIPQRTKAGKEELVITGAKANNLNDVTFKLPIGLFTCVTGVSGSGKSSLVNDTLSPLAAHYLNRAKLDKVGEYKSIQGLEYLDKVVVIDQSPIGRTPRSNAATYTGLFGHIRDLFAGTEEARSRGYKSGRFSFNVKGGRCEACQGDGLVKVEMHFLADMYVTCDVCKGSRYNQETLQVKYKGKSINEVLNLTIEDANSFFENIPAIAKKLQTLMDVGLSYITMGQSATTLSGGEAQRVKLAKELSRRDTGQTLYILDEPTTGLHFHDVQQLLKVLFKLKEHGNTLVVIEHNLDVIKTADWIIDLGPEGGNRGGNIIAEGTPEQVAKNKKSFTGKFLKKILSSG